MCHRSDLIASYVYHLWTKFLYAAFLWQFLYYAVYQEKKKNMKGDKIIPSLIYTPVHSIK